MTADGVGRRDASSAALATWLLRVEVARRQRRLYDGDHPALEPAFRQLDEATAQLARGSVVVPVTPKGFRVQGELLDGHAGRTERLAVELFRHGVVVMIVKPPLARETVRRLVELTSALAESPTEADREALLGEAGELDGVELVPLDLGWFIFADGLESVASDRSRLWNGLVAKLTGGVLDQEGAASPGELAELLEEAGDPTGLLRVMVDHMIQVLGDSEREGAHLDGVGLIASVREVIAGLGEQNSRSVARLMIQHADQPGSLRSLLPEILPVELFLDGVEALIADGVPLPRPVVGNLERLAADNPAAPDPWRRRGVEVDGAATTRAVRALERLGLVHTDDGRQRVPWFTDHPGLPAFLATISPHPELVDAFEAHAMRRHLEQLMRVAFQLFPRSELASAVGGRLSEKFFEHLELGEFSEAGEIVRELMASRDPLLREKIVGIAGLGAMLDAVSIWGKEHWPDVARIVALIGRDLSAAIVTRLASEKGMSRRRRLLEMAVTIGEPAVPAIRPMVDDPRWFVVRNGLLLLRRIGDRSVVERARELVGHSDSRVVAEAVKTLVTFRDPDWARGVRMLAQHEDEAAWREVLALSRRLRHPEIGRLIAQELSSRRGARLREPETLDLIEALGGFPTHESVQALDRLARLQQWRHPFRLTPLWEAVARAAGRMPSAAGAEVLRQVAELRDPAADVARELLAGRIGKDVR